MIGFGLDLAGYTQKKSSLAAIATQGTTAHVTLLRGSAFSQKRATASNFNTTVDEEAKDVQRCMSLGPLSVDIPIDFQGLPFPLNATELWQLTLRPIDKLLRAMPPFADRIGAPAARFAAIVRHARLESALGDRLFETYPTAIWQKLDIVPGLYKARGKERIKEQRAACSALCQRLSIAPPLYNDDDIDALICAVTSVAPAIDLWGPDDYKIKSADLPRGFRLLKRNPFKEIRQTAAEFSEWITNREKS